VFVIERATATAPGAPTGLSASVTGSSVSITWTPPATGGAATGYLLEAGTAQGATNIGTFPTSAPGLAVAGVPTGQYFVRVRATNAVGTSAPSSDITINVGCSPPAAPSTFTASAANRTVTMTWNVAGGTTTTVIDAGYAPGTTALSIPVAAPASGVAFPGVPPGTYYVRTRALNACGTSTPSVERTLVVQ
jgi:predicted phage tail protein